MTRMVFGQLNVLFQNTDAQVQGDLQQLVDRERVSLLALNEAGPTVDAGVDAFTEHNGWSEYRPKDAGSDRILWDPEVYKALPFFGARQLSDRGPAKYNPPRHLIWHGLQHRASGTRHLVYCTHLTAGYADDSKGLQAWRDQSTRVAVLRVLATTAGHMAEHSAYDFHHLLGDLNARQDDHSEWWYPAAALTSVWQPDTRPNRIDYVMHSRWSTARGLKVSRRYYVGRGIDSDHEAQIKVMELPQAR